MKKALITSAAFLLAGTMLLNGCTKNESSSAPGSGLDSSLKSKICRANQCSRGGFIS